MSIIQSENLTFGYDGSFDNIFEDVSFVIDTDWRLGFVGRNGRGKTTFLRLLMGGLEYKGKILSSVDFAYFPFNVTDKSKTTIEILNKISPLAEDWEIIKEASLLEISAEALYRPFNTLSGGEQTKALLAVLFIGENRFLLIDEPTNHLDLNARAAVGRYLRRKKGFLLVSHDRELLDLCTDHTLAINKTDIEVVAGNFSTWFEQKRRRDLFEATKNERLERDIKKLSAAVRRTAEWSDRAESKKIGFDPTKVEKSIGRRPVQAAKSKKMMARSKAIQERKLSAIDEKSSLLKNIEATETLKIQSLDYYTDVILSCKDLCAFYDGKQVFKPITFQLKQGERVAVCGKNGSGKSTFLKLIMGGKIEQSGELNASPRLKISYVSQDTANLSGSLRAYADKFGIDESLFKSILIKLDFSRTQLEKPIESLSEGQKKKVLIARSLCEKAHLYIWDEPLNFIDIFSRIQIEELLINSTATMLFVEHDSEFCKKIATSALTIVRE